MRLPNATKFACIAFRTRAAGLGEKLIDLGGERLAGGKVPFEVGAPWTNWFGSEGLRGVTEANCVLLATKASDRPDVLDSEADDLSRTAEMLLVGLRIAAQFEILGGKVLKGGIVSETPQINQIADPAPYRRLVGLRPQAVTPDDLRTGAAIADGIAAIYTEARHVRLKRGLAALRRAFKEKYGSERLHQCVRAIDGLVMSKQGHGRKQFRRRGGLFAKLGQEDVIEELYALRGQAEHMNPLQVALPDHRFAGDEQVAVYRVCQAELLACNVYARVLQSPDLRSAFRDDGATREFWQREPDAVRGLLGEGFDCNAAYDRFAK